MINVALVTSWNRECGINEHSKLLMQALAVEDDIDFPEPQDAWLDPNLFPGSFDIVHLNYHAALHSRWMEDNVQALQAHGQKVVITYHDTMAGTEDQPNKDRCRALYNVADAFIVHEPVADLPNALYWRQGIPEPEIPMQLDLTRTQGRPVVGTCGFDFPWKNYELLARCSFEAGWAVLFAGGNIDEPRQKALEDLNPHAIFIEGFLPRRSVVAWLAACDATAFLYLCANTGTSAAIRLGLAARRPMLATDPDVCRQFRDLKGESTGITWLDDLSPENVTDMLCMVTACQGRWMDRFAEQESWHRLGAKHAELYRSLV